MWHCWNHWQTGVKIIWMCECLYIMNICYDCLAIKQCSVWVCGLWSNVNNMVFAVTIIDHKKNIIPIQCRRICANGDLLRVVVCISRYCMKTMNAYKHYYWNMYHRNFWQICDMWHVACDKERNSIENISNNFSAWNVNLEFK